MEIHLATHYPTDGKSLLNRPDLCAGRGMLEIFQTALGRVPSGGLVLNFQNIMHRTPLCFRMDGMNEWDLSEQDSIPLPLKKRRT